MGIDIVKAITANNVKNGTVVLGRIGGTYAAGPLVENSNVSNTPTITTIESKYGARFDDATYYSA